MLGELTDDHTVFVAKNTVSIQRDTLGRDQLFRSVNDRGSWHQKCHAHGGSLVLIDVEHTRKVLNGIGLFAVKFVVEGCCDRNVAQQIHDDVTCFVCQNKSSSCFGVFLKKEFIYDDCV